MSSRTRASVPVVGIVLLLFVSVSLAASVGVVALERAEDPSGGARAVLSVTATGDELRVSVDGAPLAEQPSLPFFSETGFRPGPTGPFNRAADADWSAGETASFAVAETNDPDLTAGSPLTVGVRYEGQPLVTLSAVVR